MTVLRQRQPRIEDTAYLAFVRKQPCTICRRPGPNDPAHLRTISRQYGKDITGIRKPDDKWVLPLCRAHHDEQHRRNELQWWASYGIADPFALAVALYASRPGANAPSREPKRRIIKTKPRPAKSERRSIGPSAPMKSANRLPKKGQIKFQSRKERQPA